MLYLQIFYKYFTFYKYWMISESIYTQRWPKSIYTPRWPNPEAEKCGAWPGSLLFTENTRKMGMILLMTGYHKKSTAISSLIKRCNFLMTLDKTFKGNCIHKTWVIIGQADRHTDWTNSKLFFLLYIRNVMNLFIKYLLHWGNTCQQS